MGGGEIEAMTEGSSAVGRIKGRRSLVRGSTRGEPGEDIASRG